MDTEEQDLMTGRNKHNEPFPRYWPADKVPHTNISYC